ncbi:XRE family transcriptional regulator [Microbacterium sp. SSW1-49]|uniref:XRE family transcriptional regulator n=1 Tax=Microbacterium croceum TaxID=2851645 RepID=A0ABT0FA57_9MICO|nr:XRE family transcriptional regulator [Microbacterium croceum]MCK2034908.1 XRE family transcriptional regulator [Microbacterium croceum]
MDDSNLGARVRELRTLRQMSTRELARRASISAGYVSQIENGQANTSLDVVRRIAAAVGIPWTELFSAQPAVGTVLRRGERPMLSSGNSVRHFSITQPPLGNVEVLTSEYEPGHGEGGENYTHGDSQEVCVILRGKFRFNLGDQEFILEPGDSIDYRTSTPHSIVNVGDSVGEALWVVTPPSAAPPVTT